ncbi:polysaccharide biosynthesis protein [Paenibacillus mesophilus]|uniref:putative polysaccharide biosynthesis protein n=1 Tax=Paenibacillus mesophilus TaxID=2582849 RepID=UPI00110EF9C5|nr:polysaccharide biosynthesis protein [Paenibacillus mesophilus]TMV44280.1 polysaccharide biosynthesis protein [Paenibacillus mesophilus]
MQQSPNPPPMPGRAIVKGAFVLGAAAVVSKLLGTMQKIPLQNVAGDSVFGIYNAVYPLYTLILFLATAGFPVAVSRFVAEESARGSARGARGVLRMALVLSAATGLACFILLYFGAGMLASWIGDRQTEAALRSVSFALFFVPLMATLRGYFQGLGDMAPTGVSQVAEQLIRVAVMVVLLIILAQAGAPDADIAAGATLGSAAGALAGLLVMCGYWISHRKKEGRRQTDDSDTRRTGSAERVGYRRFVAYALPICLGSIVLPMLTLADTFTVPRLLMQSGLSNAEAMARFGLYNHGLPLVQLVAMIVSSMSVALVPAISEARARGALAEVRGSASASLRLTWLIGLAASAGMAVTAIPLNVMFYKDAAGYVTMMILACTTVFSVVQIVSGAILQGMGAERATAYHLLAAAAIKVGLNLWLVPRWGIEGAAVSAVAAYAAAAGLNLLRLSRIRLISLSWRDYAVKPLLSTAVMAIVTAAVLFAVDRILLHALPEFSYRGRQTVVALVSVMCGASVFGVMLFRTGAVSANELAAVPKLGAKLLPVLRKWRILQ